MVNKQLSLLLVFPLLSTAPGVHDLVAFAVL